MHNVSGPTGGTVASDNFNLFGHDASAGIVGFSPGATDVVPSQALTDILDGMLASNNGFTKTHALVFGSPAIDAVPAVSCATATDQRGVLRPLDGNLDGVPDCDIGVCVSGKRTTRTTTATTITATTALATDVSL